MSRTLLLCSLLAPAMTFSPPTRTSAVPTIGERKVAVFEGQKEEEQPKGPDDDVEPILAIPTVKTPTTTAFNAALAMVRQTAVAHASALDELERVFAAETTSKLAADQEAREAFERGAPMLQRADEANARERATAVVFPPRPWTIEDAQSGAWGLTSMRSFCAAVLHGRSVVVFGGFDRHAFPTSTTGVLNIDADGTTELFTAGPTMATARQGCEAVRLDARRVLVIGGTDDEYDSCAGSLDTTEILDLETMRFSAGPRMLSRRFECAAVALDARRILVVGGIDEDANFHRATEILEVATMTFAPGPEMLSERSGCSAVVLESSPRRVLVVGGRNLGYVNLNTTEVLDLDTMTFSPGPTTRTARYGCAAVALSGGDSLRCLVIGGFGAALRKLNLTEVLDLETMESTEGPAMLSERGGCAAVADDAGDRVFVLGGHGGASRVEVLEAAA